MKHKKFKVVIISLLIACIGATSCYIVFNYDNIKPVINSLLNTNTFETDKTDKTVISENKKDTPKKQEKAKSKKNKKNTKSKKEIAAEPDVYVYVLNTNTKRFHTDTCYYVDTIAEYHKEIVEDTRENIIEMGYKPCKHCMP